MDSQTFSILSGARAALKAARPIVAAANGMRPAERSRLGMAGAGETLRWMDNAIEQINEAEAAAKRKQANG